MIAHFLIAAAIQSLIVYLFLIVRSSNLSHAWLYSVGKDSLTEQTLDMTDKTYYFIKSVSPLGKSDF